jgi:hypothetical protein
MCLRPVWKSSAIVSGVDRLNKPELGIARHGECALNKSAHCGAHAGNHKRFGQPGIELGAQQIDFRSDCLASVCGWSATEFGVARAKD